MSNTWVPLDRNLSPTAAAVKFFNDLKAAGNPVINLGQGREIDETTGALKELLSGHISTKSEYAASSEVGGPLKTRLAGAQWLGRFFGLDVTPDQVFVIQQQGRMGLKTAFEVAALKSGQNSPAALVPNLRWPMIDDQLQLARLPLVPYDITAENLPQAIFSSFDNPTGNASTLYLDPFNNPTGRFLEENEHDEIVRAVDWLAQKEKITIIYDNPYFAAFPQNDRRVAPFPAHYLDAPLTSVDMPKNASWIQVLSFSKALATAEPGLSLIVADPKTAPVLKKALLSTSGIAYSRDFMNNLAAVFGPEHDRAMLGHFKGMFDKYAANRISTKMVFGDDMVIPGGAGMTSALRMPSDLFGKMVQCSDGNTRAIQDVNDIIEIAGNENNVVMVNNGGDLQRGTAVIRIAQAQHPDAFMRGARSAKDCFDNISLSPTTAHTPHAGGQGLEMDGLG